MSENSARQYEILENFTSLDFHEWESMVTTCNDSKRSECFLSDNKEYSEENYE